MELKRDLVRWIQDAAKDPNFANVHLPTTMDEDVICRQNICVTGHCEAELTDVAQGKNGSDVTQISTRGVLSATLLSSCTVKITNIHCCQMQE